MAKYATIVLMPTVVESILSGRKSLKPVNSVILANSMHKDLRNG